MVTLPPDNKVEITKLPLYHNHNNHLSQLLIAPLSHSNCSTNLPQLPSFPLSVPIPTTLDVEVAKCQLHQAQTCRTSWKIWIQCGLHWKSSSPLSTMSLFSLISSSLASTTRINSTCWWPTSKLLNLPSISIANIFSGRKSDRRPCLSEMLLSAESFLVQLHTSRPRLSLRLPASFQSWMLLSRHPQALFKHHHPSNISVVLAPAVSLPRARFPALLMPSSFTERSTMLQLLPRTQVFTTTQSVSVTRSIMQTSGLMFLSGHHWQDVDQWERCS